MFLSIFLRPYGKVLLKILKDERAKEQQIAAVSPGETALDYDMLDGAFEDADDQGQERAPEIDVFDEGDSDADE